MKPSSQPLATVVAMASLLLLTTSFSAYAEDPPAIYKPANDVEAAAQAVLDKHCARCHQIGKLVKKEKPAKGFGDVMQLDQLAVNPDRIVPGTPDASKLFQAIANKQMPYDVYQGGDFEKPTPSDVEVESLRTWITELGNAQSANCDAAGYNPKDLVRQMYDDLTSLPEVRRSTTRYLTLANVRAACANEAEMEVYRQGAVKLLNSLSTNSDLLTYEDAIVGPNKDIIRIDLNQLNWTPEVWDHIISLYPYGINPVDSQHHALAEITHTEMPYIRADWFGFFGSRPPLYDYILDLPHNFPDLQRKLNLDTIADIKGFLVARAGFKISGVSRSNRLIERHVISTGAFWTSYDFAETRGVQNLMEFPLGPKGAFDSYGGQDYTFHEAGGESIFNLPNGMQAYYLNDSTGKYLEKGPTNIVQDPARKDLAVTNGISCMGCHDEGIKNAKDDVRDHIAKNRIFPSEVREIVKSLYPEKDDMDKMINKDRDRFQNAMKGAGLKSNLKLNGNDEMVNALSNRYERDLDLKTAAAEFGVSGDELKDYLRSSGRIGSSLASQLAQGTVQRDEFEDNYGELVENVVDASFIKPQSHEASYANVKKNEVIEPASGKFELQIYANTPTAHIGSPTSFTVQSSKDCYLTIVDIDEAKKGTVLLPNKFEQDNLIKGGQNYVFPPDGASYKYNFETHGTETVIALCDITGHSLPAITHDFNAEAYTKLGTRSISVNSSLDSVKVSKKSKKAEGDSGIGVGDVARTAIKIEVQ